LRPQRIEQDCWLAGRYQVLPRLSPVLGLVFSPAGWQNLFNLLLLLLRRRRRLLKAKAKAKSTHNNFSHAPIAGNERRRQLATDLHTRKAHLSKPL